MWDVECRTGGEIRNKNIFCPMAFALCLPAAGRRYAIAEEEIG